MIYDCFTFFNELDLLEIRLNVLNDVVDKFVLVESSYTHSGMKKPLHFRENAARYAEFKDKLVAIEYIPPQDIILKKPYNFNWLLENSQRNSILPALDKLNANDNDIVIVSDLDEIPNPNKFQMAISMLDNGPVRFIEKMFYYYLNCIDEKMPYWGDSKNNIGSYAIKKSDLVKYSPQQFRLGNINQFIEDGGWHFSYLNGIDAIVTKIKSFLHFDWYDKPEYTNKSLIAQKIANGQDIFDRKEHHYAKCAMDNHPQYIKDNVSKYSHLIMP